MRKLVTLVFTAALATTGLSASAQATTSAAWSCPPGSVCFYSGANGVNRICETAISEVIDCKGALSYFNNGNPHYGKDHVRTYTRSGHLFGCIHYGWSEGRGNFLPPAVDVYRVKWGPEC